MKRFSLSVHGWCYNYNLSGGCRLCKERTLWGSRPALRNHIRNGKMAPHWLKGHPREKSSRAIQQVWVDLNLFELIRLYFPCISDLIRLWSLRQWLHYGVLPHCCLYCPTFYNFHLHLRYSFLFFPLVIFI